MSIPFDLAARPPFKGVSDLARHFVDCGAINAGLSLAPGERLVITDDLLNGTIADHAAMSMAAIVSRDSQIARAAIIPLGFAAGRADRETRERYERLFQLIEEAAFDDSVRQSVEALVAARFRDAQIQDLVHDLGGAIAPARQRYQDFLEIIRLLVAKRISEQAFVDEFVDFTRCVAGKLDFGIYTMCVDRLFTSENIPLAVKTILFSEVLNYPPLIRKELVANLLSSTSVPAELVGFARRRLGDSLTHEQLKEIFLFSTLKAAWQAQRALRGRKAA